MLSSLARLPHLHQRLRVKAWTNVPAQSTEWNMARAAKMASSSIMVFHPILLGAPLIVNSCSLRSDSAFGKPRSEGLWWKDLRNSEDCLFLSILASVV
ncbi:hypothetical protein BSKO_12862 [Bryopsis sp. KO-2023]|nr:hypothetical protein BSKO_12862 [Bryopsis sp. KO-2023]